MNKHGVDKVKELISNQTTNETTEETTNKTADENTTTEESEKQKGGFMQCLKKIMI